MFVSYDSLFLVIAVLRIDFIFSVSLTRLCHGYDLCTGFTYGIYLLIHETKTIETYAHFSSASELIEGTLIAFHNTIIVII
jgi:hypothetical protein